MDRLSFFYIMGLLYLEPHFNSGHAFSLIYRVEVMVPVEVKVPSARLTVASNILDSHDRIYDVEALDVKR